MTAVLIAIGVVAGVGAVAALALAIADKYLAVQEDPRIGLITAALPGANCGGCGFPGCDGYARALVRSLPVRRRTVRVLRPTTSAWQK